MSTSSNSSKRVVTPGKIGRPPAGDGGARVKDYPQVSFRLPKAARDMLLALSELRKQPQWRVIVDSVDCYVRDLPKHEREQLARLVSRKKPRDQA